MTLRGGRNTRGLQRQPSSSTSIPGFAAALEEEESSREGDGKQQRFSVGGEEEVVVKNELMLFLTLEGDLLLSLLGPTAPLSLLGGVRLLQLSLMNHR